MKGEVFLKISASEEYYYGLPPRYVMQPSEIVKNVGVEGSENWNKNKPDLFKCNIYLAYEDCGIYFTRLQAENGQKNQSDASKKGKKWKR